MIDLVSLALRERLVAAAREAATRAYCPYSQFRVGAAVLVGGQVYSGCNIENASYGLTICAERAAIFRAITSDSGRNLQALAVTCPDAPPDAPAEERMPCGACRQVMAEFSSGDLVVIIDGLGDVLLRDLLPRPFSLARSASLPGT
jgi:cytidine deaminase